MEFMILIHSDENVPTPGPGEPGFEEFMGEWMAYNQSLISGDHWVSGASLAPTTTATTLRRSPGKAPEIIDGPYIETKEQLGGYYLVSAESLDEVIELANKLPLSSGSLEIRPVAFRPDAA
ncbi:MAG: YciI family protein [Rhodoglobus sp.]